MVKFIASGWRQPWVARPSVQQRVSLARRSTSILRRQASVNRAVRAAGGKTRGRTKTRTRTKLFQTAYKRDGPVSESFFRYRYKKQVKLGKPLKQLLGDQTMVANEATRLTYAVNQQATTVLPAVYNSSDVGNILAQAATIVTSSGTNTNYKCLLESFNAKLMITNQTNDVVRLTLYDIVPRRDITNASYCPPNNAWVTGDAAAAGGTSAYQYVGSTPFQTPAFTRLYKVQKVTTLDLHTGGHHIHRTVGKPMLTFDKQTITEITAGSNTAIRNLTAYTMVVIHGYPVNDGTTKTNVGLANGAVDMVLVKQYKFKVMESSVASISQLTSNLVNPGTEALFIDVSGAASTVAVQ